MWLVCAVVGNVIGTGRKNKWQGRGPLIQGPCKQCQGGSGTQASRAGVTRHLDVSGDCCTCRCRWPQAGGGPGQLLLPGSRGGTVADATTVSGWSALAPQMLMWRMGGPAGRGSAPPCSSTRWGSTACAPSGSGSSWRSSHCRSCFSWLTCGGE